MKPTVLTVSHLTKCRSCPVRQDVVGTSPEPFIWGEQVMPRCFRYHIQSKTKTFCNFETACLKIFKASFFKIIQMFLNNMLLKNTTRNGNKLICNGTSLHYFLHYLHVPSVTAVVKTVKTLHVFIAFLVLQR